MPESQTLPPRNLILTSGVIALLFWVCAAARHALLQSNAYDLGLFDQWIWLLSRGLPPISSMEGVHVLADHGAWMLVGAALPYRLIGSVQWLLASQAAALSFTALPLWWVGRQAGLSSRLCWLACGLWWLQPVVFNANLFDFHPEVWVMPALAGCYWASRAERPWLWFALLLLLLGCRDGLVLVVAGLGLEQALRRRWIWAGAAIGLALGWLALLNRWLYPLLKGSDAGPKAAGALFSYLGDSLDVVLVNLITRPDLVIQHVDWAGGLVYLLLISVAVAPFWRKPSVPVLLGALPLVLVNVLSEEAPQRTLVHHYSLPVAVIVVVAAIDGLALQPRQPVPWRRFGWSALCWAALAKPWFFTGPYLDRVDQLPAVQEAIAAVPAEARLSTTSYLVPQLSQRSQVSFPRTRRDKTRIEQLDALLLNPRDPGWGSSRQRQVQLLRQAREAGWTCQRWDSGLELCQKNDAPGERS